MNTAIPVIAITGGPCAGKTTFLARARQFLEDHGYYVVTLPEVATLLIDGAGIKPSAPIWRNAMSFQELVLTMTLGNEDTILDVLSRQNFDRKVAVLADRGALDGMAYIGRPAFSELLELCGKSLGQIMERYVGVLYFVSAADGAESFYSTESNAARYEKTVAEALERERATRIVWNGHNHVTYIDNRTDFEGKMVRGLQALARLLGIPQPVEKERRFLVHSMPGIPEHAVSVQITQDYLFPLGAAVRRVRRRTLQGSSTYYYTEKVPGARRGENTEIERIISMREYSLLLRERAADAQTVQKVRHCFENGGHYMELDVIEAPDTVAGRVYLEIEVLDLEETVEIPNGFQVTEVTHQPGHGNYELARGMAA